MSGEGEPPVGVEPARGVASRPELGAPSGAAHAPIDVDALVAKAAQRIVDEVLTAARRAHNAAPPRVQDLVSLLPMESAAPPAADAVQAVEGAGELEPPTAVDLAPPSADPRPPAELAEAEPAMRPSPEPELEPEPPPGAPVAKVMGAPADWSTGTAALQAQELATVADVSADRPATGSGFLPLTWRRLAKAALVVTGGYFAVVLGLIVLYRFVPPPASTLMIYQWLSGTSIQKTWVPIEDMSSNLLRAVVISEDWGFCDHYGVDLEAIEKALEQAGEGKIPRGASTISMQVIKNLFLTQSKSYVRKAIEIPLTFVAELVWPKKRMLEIYLNVAEWGPGVFGAEAAAQYHFSKPAAKLTEREAALLAAVLPNPMIRDAGEPGPLTRKKASVIQSRMRAAGPVADCAMPARRDKKSQAKSDSGWETKVKNRAGAPL